MNSASERGLICALTILHSCIRGHGNCRPIWDSKEDFPSKKQPKFRLRYLKEERVLILCGRATLTPTTGQLAFDVCAGDAVTFFAGFVADWVVLEPMRKHYHYFEATGEECDEPSKKIPVIACDADGCGKGMLPKIEPRCLHSVPLPLPLL